MPIRFEIFGANGLKMAKANNGKVVIVPARAWLICKSSRINEINDPTDVDGARKFAAINIIPINKIHCVRVEFCISLIADVFFGNTIPPVRVSLFERLLYNHSRVEWIGVHPAVESILIIRYVFLFRNQNTHPTSLVSL